MTPSLIGAAVLDIELFNSTNLQVEQNYIQAYDWLIPIEIILHWANTALQSYRKWGNFHWVKVLHFSLFHSKPQKFSPEMSATGYVHGLFLFNNGVAGVFQGTDKHLYWGIV